MSQLPSTITAFATIPPDVITWVAVIAAFALAAFAIHAVMTIAKDRQK